MDFDTLYKLGTPSALGVAILINFFYWRYRGEEVGVKACLMSWLWFIGFALLGEVLAHLFYPSAYEGLGDSAARIFGFLLALLLSPFLSFSGWAFTRKLVKIKQKARKARDRARLKHIRKTANKMIKESESSSELNGSNDKLVG